MIEYNIVQVVYKGSMSRHPIHRDERRLILDNSPGGYPLLLGWTTTPSIRYFRLAENIGWVRGANAGLSLATAPFVVLMNDDVEVETEGWLELLSQPMRDDPKIAAVGPRTDRPSFQGRLKEDDPVSIVDCHPGLEHNDCIGSFPLSFFCIMFRREAIEDVGLLDMKLSPGYGDDDDWLLRAHLKGWKFAVQPRVFVHHEGSQSSTPEEKARWQARNKAYLREKWTGRI